jgi:hypothetical protein
MNPERPKFLDFAESSRLCTSFVPHVRVQGIEMSKNKSMRSIKIPCRTFPDGKINMRLFLSDNVACWFKLNLRCNQ